MLWDRWFGLGIHIFLGVDERLIVKGLRQHFWRCTDKFQVQRYDFDGAVLLCNFALLAVLFATAMNAATVLYGKDKTPTLTVDQ